MKEPTKPSFYVGIKNSKELRRNLLESSKSVIESMQKQQRISEIQKEKYKLKEKLRGDVKELKMLFSKLEKTLPEHVFETNEKIPVKHKDKKIYMAKLLPREDNAEKEIKTIHAQLEEIEKRLRNMRK